jgi:hypothetical protein
MPTPQAPQTTSEFFKTLHERLDTKFTRVVALSTTLTIGGLMLDACAGEPAPKPTHSHIETASPAPETMPTSLNVAANANYATFLTLSDQQRQQWCSWENRDMSQVAHDWEIASKNPLDRLVPINDKSSAQDLFTAAIYNIRSPLVSHENNSEVLSNDDSLKLMSCAFTDIDSPFAQSTIAELNKSLADGETGYNARVFAGQNKIQIAKTIGTPQENVVNGNRVVETEYQYADGSTGEATLTTIKGVDYNDKPTYFVTIDAHS